MINTLAASLEKRGSKYVNNFLDKDVVITEKIDTFRLIFEKKNDEIIFYTKDNKRIDLVSRTLSDIWEQAILEIPIITKEASIPADVFFGLYYSPVERPIRLPYSKLPRYILTDVTRRKKGKIIESCSYKEVTQWAGELCMGRPPVLFEGKLNEEQKKLLIAYDTKEYEGEELTFAKMIEKSFNASYSQEDIIEGIIIKSDNKLTQIISYEFDILNEAYKKSNSSRDFYDILITDINTFLSNYNIPVLEAESKDEMYIKIVCDIFNKYCEKNNVSEKIDENLLLPPQFGYYGQLNKHFIRNKESLKWINKAPIYEALFKVILSSFRKPKKPYGLLTESIVESFNGYVYLINNYLTKYQEEKYVFESVDNYINAMDERFGLNEARSENIVVDAFKKRNPTDVDNMRVIASIQKAFEPRILDVNRGAKSCVVYLTTLQPFTNSQMANIHRIIEVWNAPVLICAVSNKYRVDGDDFHASDEIVNAQMRALNLNDSSLITGFAMLDGWSLIEIFEFARPHFEPLAVITDEGKKAEMTLQLFLEEEIMGGRINVEDKFNIGEMINEDKMSILRAIEDNNFPLFLELTPEPVHTIMNNIFEEYRLWSGKIIKPING